LSQVLLIVRSVSRCRSFRFLLSPTVRQCSALVELLGMQRELYNAALEERRGAWAWERRSVSYADQCRTLTSLRAADPAVRAAGVTVSRGTLARLDRAFAAFFRRCRQGQQPGYPRFKSHRRFDSLQWEDRNGWRIDPAARRLHVHGVGAIKVHQLVDTYDVIVHEDLHITNVVRRPKPRPDGTGGYAPNGAAAKTGLDRRIHDAGWGALLAMITYKAEGAGRCVIAIEPRNTSRTCTQCGHLSAGNRHDAEFRCQACGHHDHADINAAINILRAGRAQQHPAAQSRN